MPEEILEDIEKQRLSADDTIYQLDLANVTNRLIRKAIADGQVNTTCVICAKKNLKHPFYSDTEGGPYCSGTEIAQIRMDAEVDYF